MHIITPPISGTQQRKIDIAESRVLQASALCYSKKGISLHLLPIVSFLGAGIYGGIILLARNPQEATDNSW